MSKLSEPFIPDKTKTSAEQLDEIFNHIRSQLDFLCYSAELQNEILKNLYQNSNDSRNQGENSNN